MKQLVLMRHGDALRGTPQMSDHERPLSETGKREAARAGAWLRAQGPLPEAVLCSSAKRTRETLQALEILGLSASAYYSDLLYLASPAELLSCVQALPDEVCSALVIGHNPGLHDFCLQYAVRGNADALDALALGFKTGALAKIEFAVSQWEDIADAEGSLLYYQPPEKQR